MLYRYVASMNVPGGGKNDIPNRLKRQFAIFNVPTPSTDTLNNIFGALVQVRLSLPVPRCDAAQSWASEPFMHSIEQQHGRHDSSIVVRQQQFYKIMAFG